MLSALLFTPICTYAANPFTACAIRWDAWYTNGPKDPATYTAIALSPRHFHKLAPRHAQFDADGHITWAPSQSTFDAEIRLAHRAGLCWAYLMYGRENVIDLNDPMMKSLTFHRKSSIKAQTKYAMMTTSSLLGTSGDFSESTEATVHLMQDSNYQTIAFGGTKRPLLFLYYESADLNRFFAGSLSNMKQSLDAIRQSSMLRNIGNPYVVILMQPAHNAEVVRVALGADAISEYISGTRKSGVMRWTEFEPTIEADWDTYASASAAEVVPTLRSGADIRARCNSPPPFEHRFPSGFDCESYYVETPTLEELKTEFHNAVSWVRAHPEKDTPRLLLIYAWSECDESGNCLMPTYGDPDGRKISAIASVLQ